MSTEAYSRWPPCGNITWDLATGGRGCHEETPSCASASPRALNSNVRPFAIPPVCRHFLRGYCSYGRRCKFRHPMPGIIDTALTGTRLGNNKDNRNWRSKKSNFSSNRSYDHINSNNFEYQYLESTTRPTPASTSAFSCYNTDNDDDNENYCFNFYNYDWVTAPEFVPATKDINTPTNNNSSSSHSNFNTNDYQSLKTYAQVAGSLGKSGDMAGQPENLGSLCPCATFGQCQYGPLCLFMHGDV